MPKTPSLESVLVAQLGGDPRSLKLPLTCYIFLGKSHIGQSVHFENRVRGKNNFLKVTRSGVLRGVIRYAMLRFEENEKASGFEIAKARLLSGPFHQGVPVEPAREGSFDAKPVKTEVYMPVPLTNELITYAMKILGETGRAWRWNVTQIASHFIKYGLFQLHEEKPEEAIEFLRLHLRAEGEDGLKRGRPPKVVAPAPAVPTV